MTRLLPAGPVLARPRRSLAALPSGLPTALTFAVSVGAVLLGSAIFLHAALSSSPRRPLVEPSTWAAIGDERLAETARFDGVPPFAGSSLIAAGAATPSPMIGSDAAVTAAASGERPTDRTGHGLPGAPVAGMAGDSDDLMASPSAGSPSQTPSDDDDVIPAAIAAPAPNHADDDASMASSPRPAPTDDDGGPGGEARPTTTPAPTSDDGPSAPTVSPSPAPAAAAPSPSPTPPGPTPGPTPSPTPNDDAPAWSPVP